MKNEDQTLPAFLELRENLTGDYKSLFAKQDIESDVSLITFKCEAVHNTPDRYSIQIEEDKHITLNPGYLQYINHNCNPNVWFDTKNMELRTLRTIAKGEEIAFFYPSTEWKMIEAFDCLCGSDNCLGQISGAAFLSKEVLEEYRLSEFILKRLVRNP